MLDEPLNELMESHEQQDLSKDHARDLLPTLIVIAHSDQVVMFCETAAYSRLNCRYGDGGDLWNRSREHGSVRRAAREIG